jgi:hypothetical protein
MLAHRVLEVEDKIVPVVFYAVFEKKKLEKTEVTRTPQRCPRNMFFSRPDNSGYPSNTL